MTNRDTTPLNVEQEQLTGFEVFEALPGVSALVAVDAPKFTLLAVTEDFLQVTGRSKEELLGKGYLDPFPQNPEDSSFTGDIDLLASYQYVLQNRKVHSLPQLRYDIKNQDGSFTEYYWSIINKPVLDKNGAVVYIIHTATDITAQVKAQVVLNKDKEEEAAHRQLIQSEERFSAAIKAVRGILWTNTAEGKMEGEQPGWAALTGQRFEEYQDYGWAKAVHPDDAQPTIDAWNEAVSERKPFLFEHRVKTQKGEWRLFSIRAIPLLYEDGSLREWVGVHTDITEQRIGEQKLRESEERFRSLADQAPMIVYLVEADSKASMSYFNKTWLHYTGQSFEEAIGRAWEGVVHPEDLTVVFDIYTAAFEKRESYTLPAVRLKRYDGVYRWHHFKGNPRYLSDGSFIGFVGVGIEIHEQKLAEEAIRQSESELQQKVTERTIALEKQRNLLDSILTNSSNGISVSEMIRDEKGKVINAQTILANESAIKLTGLPKEVYLSKTAVELDPGILSSAYFSKCMHTLETGEPTLIQYYFEYTGRWLELTMSRMDEEHLIHIFTDVTPIKEAQLQLERTVDELKRSNVNLEEFAYAASHDLKEPIRKIHFFTDRLKVSLAERLADEEKHFFERMDMASRRMSNLIDDLLSYSQVSIKPKELEPVDLNDLINQVLEDLDLEIEEKKAVVRVAKMPGIYGHQRQLQQAFQNLISNSLKYSKPGVAPLINISATKVLGSHTEVNWLQEGATKEYLLIKVQDNGIGFEQKDAERIFNVFTRLQVSNEFKGTGVGLSIVRKVIENHQGRITAEAEPGKGATFKIYLPFV